MEKKKQMARAAINCLVSIVDDDTIDQLIFFKMDGKKKSEDLRL